VIRHFSIRVGQALLALLVVLLLVFLSSRATGSPLDLLLGPQATQADYARLERELGLDQPIHVQFGRYAVGLASGDMGKSLRTREPVASMIASTAPASIVLGTASLAVAALLAVPLGVFAASHRGQLVDRATTALSVFWMSMAPFWFGIVLIAVFAVRLRWFPAGGNAGIRSIVLPGLTLALFATGGLTRLIRTSMLEALGSEYVRLARSTGASERRVLWRHALRNALLPAVNYLGILFALVITVNAVVEAVFDWPGLGRMVYNAILSRDFPVVQGLVLLAATIAIGVNLLVDVVMLGIDPRTRRG